MNSSNKKIRLVITNSYPMDAAHEAWRAGTYPGHHLWGTSLFEKYNIEVSFLKHIKYGYLNTIGNLFKIKFIDQQVRILRNLRNIDVVYSPFGGGNTRLLIILKILRIINVRIVILAHQPLFKGKNYNSLKKFFLRTYFGQFDRIIFLSNKLKSEFLKSIDLEDSNIYPSLEWGADLQFYSKIDERLEDNEIPIAISAGNTGRDFSTLIKSFTGLPYKLIIYCTPGSKPIEKINGNNILIDAEKFEYNFSSPLHLLEEYNKIDLVTIPLKDQQTGLQGYTSLLDAMAMGKPVIITKNPYININVEKEGIGLEVDPYDIDGWNHALETLLSDKDKLKRMGFKAKKLCNDKYNIKVFANNVAEILNSCMDIQQFSKNEEAT